MNQQVFSVLGKASTTGSTCLRPVHATRRRPTNHDELVFGEDAMHFDVRRAERMPDLYNQLRSFGIGLHFCIGSHLARLELRVMFEEIITRLRNPRRVAPTRCVKSFFVNAIKEMRIQFDGAPL